MDQDGVVKFEEVLQVPFSDQAEGAAIDFSLEVFVFHQRFADLPDMDVRVFHAPDLAALERLEWEGLFRGRVLHRDQF